MKHTPELIVMLTHNDVTVPDAAAVFARCQHTRARYWGFKEEGLPFATGEYTYNVLVTGEDGKQTVAKYLEEVSKAVGGTVKVKRFVRFETGEGLEKKQEDFAAEVAAQMNA